MEIREENRAQKAGRTTKNAWTRCKGFAKKTDILARIQVKESEKVARKKSFGVQYMDLFEKGASDEELQDRVRVARSELDEIQHQIDELRRRLSEIEQKMKNKIASRNGEVDPLSIAVTDAAEEGATTTATQRPNDYHTAGDDFERVTIDGTDSDDNVNDDGYLSPSAPPSTYDDSGTRAVTKSC